MALAASIYLATHILLQASASPSALLGEGAAQTLIETSGGSPVAPAPPPGSGLPSAPVQPIQIAQVQPQQQAETHVQAPAPRDLFIEECYEIDAEGRGHIDWYGLGSEAEAEECFKQLATKAGTPDAFAEILRSNGLKVYAGEFLQGPVVEGYKFIPNYIEAGQYFGYFSYLALRMFHPVALIATWLTGHKWTLRAQVIYKVSPEVKPDEVNFRYDISFK